MARPAHRPVGHSAYDGLRCGARTSLRAFADRTASSCASRRSWRIASRTPLASSRAVWTSSSRSAATGRCCGARASSRPTTRPCWASTSAISASSHRSAPASCTHGARACARRRLLARPTLHARGARRAARRAARSARPTSSLNDAVLHKGGFARVVRLAVYVGEGDEREEVGRTARWHHPLHADGLDRLLALRRRRRSSSPPSIASSPRRSARTRWRSGRSSCRSSTVVIASRCSPRARRSSSRSTGRRASRSRRATGWSCARGKAMLPLVRSRRPELLLHAPRASCTGRSNAATRRPDAPLPAIEPARAAWVYSRPCSSSCASRTSRSSTGSPSGSAPGLNVLSGETGAGKSIVVGALSLLLGERASADLVRAGADRAVGRRRLRRGRTRPDVLELLADQGLEAEDGLLILRREVAAEGREPGVGQRRGDDRRVR